jgi:hypothetical protein
MKYRRDKRGRTQHLARTDNTMKAVQYVAERWMTFCFDIAKGSEKVG